MSGHSKWAQIKRKKSKEDVKRGQLFSKLIRAVIIAAKKGPNPETNPQLAQAIERARSFHVPQENIERAIKKAAGEGENVSYEQIFYEGYGPGGVAYLVEVMTDNRNRTAAEIRNIFSSAGGSLAESGSVSWLFERKGLIVVSIKSAEEEERLLEIALEEGADDVITRENEVEVITSPETFSKVKKALQNRNFSLISAEITMLPQRTVRVESDEARKVLRLLEALEGHEDVQEVYSNFDIPESVFEEIAAGQ